MARSLQIPQYTTGTIAIGALSGGSWPLTGAGTNFLSPDGVSNWTVAVGDIVVVAGVGFGIVGAVNSATSLSLAFWSGGTVAAGSSYALNRLTGIPSQAAAGFVQQLTAKFSGIYQRVSVADANYAVQPTDISIAFTTLTASRVATLCASTAYPTGTLLMLFDESGACSPTKTITLAASGGDTIDGGSTSVLATPYGCALLQSNGAGKWTNIVASYTLPAATGSVLGGVKAASTTTIASDGTLSDAMGFRNRVINGDMRIAQRGTSFSIGAGAINYPVDRWLVYPAGGAVTAAQVAGPTGFRNAIQVTGAAGVTQVEIAQRLESYLCADLVGGNVTLQANIAVSTAQTVLWLLTYANSADNFATQTTIASGTWSAGTTAATYSALISSLPAGAANGMMLAILPQNGAAFTSGTINVTGVQLEPGSYATPFERRPYGLELALCQRYLPAYSYAAAGDRYIGLAYSTTGSYPFFNFPVTPRVPPTGVSVSSPGHWNVCNYASSTIGPCSALTMICAGASNGALQATTTAGSPTLTAGAMIALYATNTAALILFTGCEL